MAATTAFQYDAVKENLVQTIRRHRRIGVPVELARELLAVGHAEYAHLVGLGPEAEHAYFHHLRNRYVVRVAIEADGLADAGLEVARFEPAGPGVEVWVGKISAWWSWLHPRYR